MLFMQSLVSLLLLLIFFGIMGLGVANAKTAKQDVALLPVFGFAALISIAYILSANLNISGANAMAAAIVLLLGSFLWKMRRFRGLLTDIRQNNLYMLLAVIAIPVFSLIFPALYFGFKYFYAYANFDYFYNSQDAWYLQTYSVLHYNYKEGNLPIVPLTWSASFSGRIAVALIGAFFGKWLHVNTLQFDSLLLNTIVVLFALSMSVFCRDFFRFSKKTTLLAIFFAMLSAGYVQAYCYYVLGQISVAPIFLLYCIFLKRFLDQLADPKHLKSEINTHILILALLLNTLFFMYAITSFFALCLTVVSYAICFPTLRLSRLNPLIKTVALFFLLFGLARLLVIHESYLILKAWISLANHVADAKHSSNPFIPFSEYLTESYLSLFFGIANYPSVNSIFKIQATLGKFLLLIILGGLAFLTSLITFIYFAYANPYTKSAKAIVISLFAITLSLATYFFFTSAAYGMFKLQTWFMPVLIPIYVYAVFKLSNTPSHVVLKIACAAILVLNVISSKIYIANLLIAPIDQRFVNLRGMTGKTDFADIADKLKAAQVPQFSVFLTNGLETAWLMDLVRDLHYNKVIHNLQPVQEKDLAETTACSSEQNFDAATLGWMIIPTSTSSLGDITSPPVGGKVVYSNASYTILDPKGLQTFMYIGSGSYPVEYLKTTNAAFPGTFRWVEKGMEVVIYSNKERQTNISAEVTPGYVHAKTATRNILIKTGNQQYHYAITKKTLLQIPGVKLHSGWNCLIIESPDKVTHLLRSRAIIHPNTPADPRLTNFAVSYVGFAS